MIRKPIQLDDQEKIREIMLAHGVLNFADLMQEHAAGFVFTDIEAENVYGLLGANKWKGGTAYRLFVWHKSETSKADFEESCKHIIANAAKLLDKVAGVENSSTTKEVMIRSNNN